MSIIATKTIDVKNSALAADYLFLFSKSNITIMGQILS
jgi:hypothetical protein